MNKIRAETTTGYSWLFFWMQPVPTIAGIGSSTHVTLSDRRWIDVLLATKSLQVTAKSHGIILKTLTSSRFAIVQDQRLCCFFTIDFFFAVEILQHESQILH